jgi:iron complex transport system substrate-binding protein
VVSVPTLPTGLTPQEIDAEVKARMAAGADLYRLDEGALRGLDPDLVVTQDLCAVCAVDVGEVDAALEHLGCSAQVLTVDPETLEEVLASITTLGAASGCAEAADLLVGALRDRLGRVAAAVRVRAAPRVALLEWTDPPFTAGHWIPDMVSAAGAVPALGRAGSRSQEITWPGVAASDPAIVVIAPCGFDLAGALDLATLVADAGVLPDGVELWAVDADAAFVRPGPRLVDGVEALAAIAHPGAVAPRPDLAVRLPRS